MKFFVRVVFWWLLSGVVLVTLVAEQPEQVAHPEPTVLLTKEEREFLQELGTVTMLVDPYWLPYELLTEDSEFIGIAADLLELIFGRLGVEYEIVPTADWAETLEVSQSGGAHILAFLNETPERQEWLTFTDVYFVDPNVFITRQEHAFITDPRALDGAKLVLPEGTSVEERLRRDYPNIDIVTVPTENEVFEWVEQGKAQLTLRSLTVAAWTIREDGWFNLKVAGELAGYENLFRIGVLHEHAPLVEILNKGIATLSPVEVQEIVNRHTGLVVKHRVDYGAVVRAVAVMSVLVVLAGGWALHSRRLNRRLVEQTALALENSRRFEELSLQSRSFAWEVDAEGLYSYVSDNVKQVGGYRPADLVGNRFFYELTPVEDRPEVKSHAFEMMHRQETMTNYENRLVRADGEVIWVESSGVPVTDSRGRVAGYRGLDKDVTDRKQAEFELERYKEALEQMVSDRTRQLLAAEKLAAIGILAAGMGHEINNPVSFILMNGQILQEAWPAIAQRLAGHSQGEDSIGGLPAGEFMQRARQAVDDILEGGRRIEAIVSNLRVYAMHGETVELSEIDLNEAVRGALYFCQHRIDAVTRQFDLKLHPAPLLFDSSLGHCEHVILNLLMNACHALTDPGQSISLRTGIGDAGEYYVLVCDEGCGMDEATLDKITDPFFTTRRNEGGTGLGLSVATQMAGELGGRLQFESTPGKGTCVWFWLPVRCG
ncbi:ATP-binding protein [Spirochaeta africana]|uniref:histidine kinase n=1 Tax=Spirochaeta africana (strain ATCC 700263 / DSM 8902 / Z-7692) TaxID=889378 RepID=H9UH42_SPIAZ|nr:transporter substrate-binding domain-containing protein [Spirochaeta africana]AFG36835.1 PAS domain S-box [Spirochaeta africana DSM 8902]